LNGHALILVYTTRSKRETLFDTVSPLLWVEDIGDKIRAILVGGAMEAREHCALGNTSRALSYFLQPCFRAGLVTRVENVPGDVRRGLGQVEMVIHNEAYWRARGGGLGSFMVDPWAGLVVMYGGRGFEKNLQFKTPNQRTQINIDEIDVGSVAKPKEPRKRARRTGAADAG